MSFTPISPPSAEHFLGVNDGGQDIFSELIFAIRNTVTFGMVSGIVALGVGVIIGLVAGWLGGFIDMILMRLADVLLAIPAIMILILTASLFRPSSFVLSLILSGFMWPTISKAIRAQTLTLRESLHVKAAAQIGGSNWYIIRRHLMPEMFPLYLIGLAAKTRMAMFMEASLAFLGLFDPSRKSLCYLQGRFPQHPGAGGSQVNYRSREMSGACWRVGIREDHTWKSLHGTAPFKRFKRRGDKPKRSTDR
jgi:peptide/nickel transport system permease protein